MGFVFRGAGSVVIKLSLYISGVGVTHNLGVYVLGVFVGGGVRIHPENARMSGRHGVQYVAQCVACAALTLVVWQ